MEKQAFDLQELANNALRAARDELGNFKQIRERPFEILLKYMIPGLLFMRSHFFLALLMVAANSLLGIGPETIGAWIDKAIGKGPGGDTGAVSESSLGTAANGVVEWITTHLLSKSSAFRTEIIKRGTIDAQSLIIALAHGPDKLEKQAYRGSLNKLKNFLVANPIRGQGLISGLLSSLLKSLLVGLGLQTGVNMLLGDKTTSSVSKTSPTTTTTTPTTVPGMRLYTNPAGNVAQSLVMALDNTIKDKDGKPFSKLFTDLKGYSPVESSEMDRVLSEVRAAHTGATIQEINSYKTFAAPPLAEIAKMLLPMATYTKQTTVPKSNAKELEDIIGRSR